jgi:mono/diheme cytochrome c family protein
MLGLGRHLLLAGLMLAAAQPAAAIDNLDKGKSAQQLFVTNCSACHRTAQGLGATARGWSLSGFLAEHYTASKAAADALAGYLVSVNKPSRDDTRPPRRRTARPDKNGSKKKN